MPFWMGLLLTANARLIPSFEVRNDFSFTGRRSLPSPSAAAISGAIDAPALGKHPLFHLGKFGLVRISGCRSKTLSLQYNCDERTNEYEQCRTTNSIHVRSRIEFMQEVRNIISRNNEVIERSEKRQF